MSRAKLMNPDGASCKLFWQSNVANTSINIRKIKFIAYIYIRFNRNLNEKINMYISAETETISYLHAIFSTICGLSVEQHRRSDCREP